MTSSYVVLAKAPFSTYALEDFSTTRQPSTKTPVSMFLKSSDTVQIISGVDEKNVQAGDEVQLTLSSESHFSSLQIGTRGAELLARWQASLSKFQAAALFPAEDLQKLSGEGRASLDRILQHNPLYLVFHRFEGIFPRLGIDVYCQLASPTPDYELLRHCVSISKRLDLLWRRGYVVKEQDLATCTEAQWQTLTQANFRMEHGRLHSPYYDQIHRKARTVLLEIIERNAFCDSTLSTGATVALTLQDMQQGLGQHALMDQLFERLAKPCYISIVELKNFSPGDYDHIDPLFRVAFANTNFVDFGDTWLMEELEQYLTEVSLRVLVLSNMHCLSAFHVHLLFRQIRDHPNLRQRVVMLYNGDIESTSTAMLRMLRESVDSSMCDSFEIRNAERWSWPSPVRFFEFPSLFHRVSHTPVSNLERMISTYFEFLLQNVRTVFLCYTMDELEVLAAHGLTQIPFSYAPNTVMSLKYDYGQPICYYQMPHDAEHSLVDKISGRNFEVERCVLRNDELECCNARLLDGTTTRVACAFFYTEQPIDSATMYKLESLVTTSLILITKESNLSYLWH